MLRLQINVGTSAVLAALVALAPRLDAAGAKFQPALPKNRSALEEGTYPLKACLIFR